MFHLSCCQVRRLYWHITIAVVSVIMVAVTPTFCQPFWTFSFSKFVSLKALFIGKSQR